MNACNLIYEIGAENKIYGTEKGICKITGSESNGLKFNDWVKSTFNDYDSLLPGTIISNEALFCFDEASEIVQQRAGKEKLQRFRTYSHIICNNEWYCLTKADKKKIFELVCAGAEMVCLTDSGQKHILFKHKQGFWQLDEIFIEPDIELLKYLHANMCNLMRLGFSQNEIITGDYISNRVLKAGIDTWKALEAKISTFRGIPIFDFAAWMLFIEDEDKKELEIQREKSKTKKTKPESQQSLFE